MSNNWTKEQYESFLRSKDTSTGKHGVIQKFQDAYNEESRTYTASSPFNHKPRLPKENEKVGTGYRIDVVWLVSDKRRRDPTGMFETVADVLIRAVRRFNQGVTGGVMDDAKGS